MSSDAQDLATICDADRNRQTAQDVTKQVIGEMKSSLIFQYKWQDLLQAAPTSISSMGACFTASASTGNVHASIDPPVGGFKYLKYTSVDANLIECGNLGRFAFLEAENGLGKIQQSAQVFSQKIREILQLLGDPPSARKLLKIQLGTLQNGTSQCLDAATKIDKKFETWLLYVCEMHAACVQQQATNDEKILSNNICRAAEQALLGEAQDAVKAAKETNDRLGKQVDLAGDAFKAASDNFPTGWSILGQQVVGDLAHCLTSALNQAIPVLVDRLNPLKEVKAAGDIVGGFVHPPKEDGAASSEPDPANRPVPVTPQPPNGLPKNARDPAYAEALKSITYVSGLRIIVDGKDGNIDWEKARGDGSDESTKSTIKFLKVMLETSQKHFQSLADAQGDASNTLRKALDKLVEIATAIDQVVDSTKDVSKTPPARDSDEVQKWRSDTLAQYQEVNVLAAAARSTPGAPASGVPLMADPPEVQTAKINAQTTQAQAVLDAGKNRLATTQATLLASQKNYNDATKNLNDQQKALGDIQATLSRCTASKLSFEEIKGILVECIKLIINLKQQITNLVRFFNALTTIIEICITTHVDPFLQTIQASTAADGTDPTKNFQVGGYTLEDLQRSMLYSAAITIQSYFSVFQDIASMWARLSNEHIMPGLRMCDDLAAGTGRNKCSLDDMVAKFKQLENWSQSAAGAVQDLADTAQKQILDGMDANVQHIVDTTKQIKAPPAGKAQEAITAGTAITAAAAQDTITQLKKSSSLSRWGDTGI